MPGIILSLILLVYKYNDSLKIYIPEVTIVSATKLEEPIEYTGKWVTVITREEIEKNGDIMVLEAIRNFPGLHVVPRGPFGGVTEVHLRGGRPAYVLVLIDGVKVNDPTSIDRKFDWGTLSTSAVERIEIIRNPQCALYGSDAISGVINIITKKGQPGNKINATVWAKPYNTFTQQAEIMGGTRKFDYFLSVFNITSQGISKTVSLLDTMPTPERDGYSNKEVYANLNFYPFNKLSFGLIAGSRKSRIEVDAGPFKDDPNAIVYPTYRHSSVFMTHKLTELWNYKLSLGINKVYRKEVNDPDIIDTTKKNVIYRGDYINAAWQNNLTINEHLQIVTGVEHTDESGSCECEKGYPTSDNLPQASLVNRSAYIEIMPNYKDVFFTLGGRIDDYRGFGRYKTWQASLTFIVNFTRFKLNYGLGFKMPSIYQLFSPQYGNTKLTPETTRGFDVGGEHRFKNGVIAITYYNQHIGSSIDLVEKFVNRSKGSVWCIEGMELYFLLYILKDLSTDISFTGLDKVDNPADYLLLPSLDYRWGVTYKRATMKFCCIGKRQDRDPISEALQLVDLRSCSKIDFTLSFEFRKIRIQPKIENLIDDRSMESAGYTVPGRGFSIGISYTLE